jgi:hypothetical protein
MEVGEVYQVVRPMSGRVVEWTIQAIGGDEVRLSGVWFKRGQVEKWIERGDMKPLITKREGAQEQ